MATRGLFRGHGLQGIDAKGRVGIPATMRAIIERNAGDRLLVLDIHPDDPCLTGADTGVHHDDIALIEAERARALEGGRTADRYATHRFYASSEDVPFDASGRFILPSAYRDHAGLDDLAFFLGAGARFEIWNPRTLLDAAGVPDTVKALCRHHLAQRGAA